MLIIASEELQGRCVQTQYERDTTVRAFQRPLINFFSNNIRSID